MDVKGLKGKGGKKYGQWSIGVFEELRNSANTNKDNASHGGGRVSVVLHCASSRCRGGVVRAIVDEDLVAHVSQVSVQSCRCQVIKL